MNDREDAAREFALATVVFEGEVALGGREVVAHTQDKPGLGMIAFRVIRAYKGVHDQSIQLYDSAAGTDCGGWAQEGIGKKYFVYGFQGTDGKIYIQACTRTSPLDAAGADIRFARNEPATKGDLAPPGERLRLYRDPTLAQRGASLRGAVRRKDTGDLSNVFVTVWDLDETGRRSSIGLVEARQKVNVDGSFEIRFLPPGKYNVTAEDFRAGSAGKCAGEYGNVVLAERQVLSHLGIKLTCKAVRDSAPR